MRNPKNLKFNQEGAEPKKYRYTPSGLKKSVLIHIMKRGECSKCYEDLENCYSDGIEIWERLPIL